MKKQTGRENMKIWQGACIVHATFPARRVTKARMEHPNALVVAHPECPRDVLAMADYHRFHFGTDQLLRQLCRAEEFIVMTESGVSHSLQQACAAQEVLLRPERKLQLQRVSVHEAEHAREAARLPARPSASRRDRA